MRSSRGEVRSSFWTLCLLSALLVFVTAQGPTGQPTSKPSLQPTSQPSLQPSRQPSDQPSVQPTGRPTGQPSRQPSGQPSSQPTVQPTPKPSPAPTRTGTLFVALTIYTDSDCTTPPLLFQVMSQVTPDQASSYSSTYEKCSSWNGGDPSSKLYAVYSGGNSTMPSPPNTNAYLIQQYPTASACPNEGQSTVKQYYLNGGCQLPGPNSTTFSAYTCTTSGYSVTTYADSACSLKVKSQFTAFPADCSVSNSTYSCVFATRAPPADTTALALGVGLGVGLGGAALLIAGVAYTMSTEKLKISWTSSAPADTPLLSSDSAL